MQPLDKPENKDLSMSHRPTESDAWVPVSRQQLRQMTRTLCFQSKILTGSRRLRRQKSRLASRLMMEQIKQQVMGKE